MTRASSLRRPLGAVLCAAALFACSARHGSNDGADHGEPVTLPPDCQAYAASYEQQLAAAAPGVARELADQTRASLRAEAERIGVDALAAKCRMNLQRIAAPTAAPSR